MFQEHGMETLIQIWEAVVALVQALAIIGVYLIVVHLVMTIGDYLNRREKSYAMDVPEMEIDEEEDVEREFKLDILDGRELWNMQERAAHMRLAVLMWIEEQWGPNCVWTRHPGFTRADFERLLEDWKHWVMPEEVAEEMAREFPERSAEESSDTMFILDWFYGHFPVEQAEDYLRRYELIEAFQTEHRQALLATHEQILQPGGADGTKPRDRLSPAFLDFILGGFVEPLFPGQVGHHLLLEQQGPCAYDQTLAAFRIWLAKQGRHHRN